MSSRILLADVNPNIQQMVTRALAAEQIETVCASDGWTALNLLNETTPDLLIAEISLPDKSGYELCRYIRGEPEFKSLPIVLLDDHFDVFNQGVAHSLGADMYLSKPFDPGSVVGVVRKLLGSRGETYDEATAPDPSAETRQQSPFLEMGSSREADRQQGGRRIVTASHPLREQAITTSSPKAIRPQAQPRSRVSIPRWAVLAGAILAVIGLAMLERALTARNTSPVERPLVMNPMTVQQPSADDQARGSAGLPSEQPPGSAPQREGARGTTAESEYSPAGGDTISSGSQDEASEEADAGPTHGTAESSTDTAGTPSAESTAGASAQRKPSAALPSDSRAVIKDQGYTSAARPRRVSPIGPATTRGHLKRSGEEMKEAGEHFGSGVKHFWKSGEKAAIKTGKKVGGGVKRVGHALRKIF
jgi:DNA-binding response OmpR family regulator